MSLRNLTKEDCLVASLQYLGAAAKLLRLMHEFEHPQVRSCLGQYAVELEATAKTYQDRATTFLDVRDRSTGEVIGTWEEPRSLPALPPPSDTDPPSPVPQTLRSERIGT